MSVFNVPYRTSVCLLDCSTAGSLLLFILGVNSRCPVPSGAGVGAGALPWIWERNVEGRWVWAGAAAPVQVLEKPRLGAGEQQPETPVSRAGVAAWDVLMERQIEGARLDRGCGGVCPPSHPTGQPGQIVLSGPRNHSKIWSSGRKPRNAYRHLLLLWSKPLHAKAGVCLLSSLNPG